METYESTRWERLFEAIYELSGLISAGPHREEQILERILRSALSLLDARFVHLLLVENERIRRLVLSRDEKGREVLSAQLLSRSTNLVKWIQQEQAEALLQPPELLMEEIGSFKDSIAFGPPMSSPLFAGGKTRGILIVFPQESSFSPEDAKLLGFLANQASVVLELARLYHRLETEASTDGLTGLYNYRYFMDALHREVKRASRFQEPFAVVMVDVDNLKEYNDVNGHLAGSSALREMGSLLRTDAREIDIIAKYGGDEFSLILPNTNAEGSIVFAERMLRRVAGHRFHDDPQRRLTVSAGIAVYPEDGDSARELLSRADDRLYLAKSEGRDRIGYPLSPPVPNAAAPED